MSGQEFVTISKFEEPTSGVDNKKRKEKNKKNLSKKLAPSPPKLG
jgi:hypothetical protein